MFQQLPLPSAGVPFTRSSYTFVWEILVKLNKAKKKREREKENNNENKDLTMLLRKFKSSLNFPFMFSFQPSLASFSLMVFSQEIPVYDRFWRFCSETTKSKFPISQNQEAAERILEFFSLS